MPTGTIIVYEEERVAEKAVVIYARVSSDDRKEDLAGQVERLKSFASVEAALVSQGRNIIVTDETEETGDVRQDFADVVTSMCARIYGRRGAKNRARRALDAAGMNENQG